VIKLVVSQTVHDCCAVVLLFNPGVIYEVIRIQSYEFIFISIEETSLFYFEKFPRPKTRPNQRMMRLIC
jgi:hypothetical protein